MSKSKPLREELANEIKVLREYIHRISEVSHNYHLDGNISKKNYIKKVDKVLADYYLNEEMGLNISELTQELFQ